MTENENGLNHVRGPQIPQTAEIREQLMSGELDLGVDFQNAMQKSVVDGLVSATPKPPQHKPWWRRVLHHG